MCKLVGGTKKKAFYDLKGSSELFPVFQKAVINYM